MMYRNAAFEEVLRDEIEVSVRIEVQENQVARSRSDLDGRASAQEILAVGSAGTGQQQRGKLQDKNLRHFRSPGRG